MHESRFVEDDKIQAGAAQSVGVVGGTNRQPAAAGEVDAAFGFINCSVIF